MCAQAQKYVHEINSAPTCYILSVQLSDTHADTFALFPERKPRIPSMHLCWWAGVGAPLE